MGVAVDAVFEIEVEMEKQSNLPVVPAHWLHVHRTVILKHISFRGSICTSELCGHFLFFLFFYFFLISN